MIWKTIPGFSRYEASEDGRIRNRFGRIMRTHPGNKNHRTPYRRLCLVDDEGRERQRNVHVLICETFHGPRPPGLEVRHLDGVSDHNCASNLLWGTRAEQLEDIRRHKAAREKT